MHLVPGMRLGVYEILAPLGAGGMGEVYRARDLKLQRDVAVKVLPAGLANDSGPFARFQREALVLASLNHPNIAHLYGVEDGRVDGLPTPALIMELVEGHTLAELIARGPLPLDQALDIARQIAVALDAAHDRGVVHRDLKPANIKVAPDGTVKVLDFGLAKALEPGAAGGSEAGQANSPTVATPLTTQPGVLLGTAAYMPPEQVRGRGIDKRADIWAFGCVVYEMLTGRPPFHGDTTGDTMVAVLHADIDWRALPPVTPLRIRRLLGRCLERDPRRRLRDIGDGLAVLDEQGDDRASNPPAVPGTRSVLFARLLWIVVGVVLGALATALLGGRLLDRAPAASTMPIRFAIEPPGGYEFGPVRAFTIAFSPDSQVVAAIVSQGGTNRLMLRALDDLTPRLVSGSDGVSDACFSPDGSQVAIYGYGMLKKANLAAGGQFGPIAPLPDAVGMAWGPNDRIVVGTATGGLLEVSASGGPVRQLTVPGSGELHHQFPAFLPSGKGLLYTAWRPAGPSVYVLTPEGRPRLLVNGARQAWYSEAGLVFQSDDGNLNLVPFDLTSLRVTGSPRRVTTASSGNDTLFTISPRGDLAYDTGNWGGWNDPVWVDRHGNVQAIPMPPHRYNAPRLSPDGKRMAIETREGNQDIWVYDLARATMTRLTFDPGEDESAVWSPDGRTIAYKNERLGEILTKASDGTGAESVVARTENPHLGAWSPDGRSIAINLLRASSGEDIDVLDVASGRLTPFVDTPANEVAPSFSPDGRWLAYSSDESGQYEVYVRRFPSGDGRWLISNGGGVEPVWARNGRELFYRHGDTVLSVPVDTRLDFSPGLPRVLFQGDFLTAHRGEVNYDVAPDGQRFIFLRDRKSGTHARLIVVRNWLQHVTSGSSERSSAASGGAG